MLELVQAVRLALRGFWRRPMFFLPAVLTLALAIGSNVAIFSFVEALLWRPLPFPDSDRLVRILAFKDSEAGHLSQREIEDLQAADEVFGGVAAYYHSQYNLTGEGPPEAAPTAINTHQLFKVLGAGFVHGGTFDARGDFIRQYRVILQHDFWQRRFGGDPEIVGKSIVLDGGSYVVDGVLAEGTDYPPGVQLFRQVTEYHGLDGRRHSVIARLLPGVSLFRAQAEVDRLAQRWLENQPEIHRGLRFEVVPLRDSWVGAARPYLALLAAGVAFVLLIAMVNVINLQLSRASERRPEMAVRSALGASKSQLVRQGLVESLLLAVIGGALGVGLAFAWLRVLDAWAAADLPAWMEVRIDSTALVFAGLLALGSGMVIGLLPAWAESFASKADGAVRGGLRGTPGRAVGRLRKGLVVAQVALALALLLAAGVMIRSVLALDRQDLGFDAENLFTFRVDPPYWSYNQTEQMVPFFFQAIAELQRIPGVEAVAANQNLPLAGLDANSKRVVTLEGQSARDQESNPFIHLQAVGSGYFQAMEIPLWRGRTFTSDDRQETVPVAVVSRFLAEKLWPDSEALGRRLKLGPPGAEEPWLEVVGVVSDVRSENRVGAPSADLYISHLQHFTGDTYFALRSPLGAGFLFPQAELAIQRVDPDLPLFDVAPMGERVAAVEWQRELTSSLLVTFGALALALAATGIYGVISLGVSLRTREIGVRIAMGAVPGKLFSGVLRDGLRLSLWGVVLGLATYVSLIRWLESLLYEVSATDPRAVLGAVVILLAVAALACFLPARRAAKLDPLTAIRTEN